MSEYAWHLLVHRHSSFWQLSGVFPTGPCRAITRVPVPGQSHLSWDRSLTWIAPELEELASKVLTMKMVTARKRQSLREERTGAPPASGQKK